jgi:hypothetical protein
MKTFRLLASISMALLISVTLASKAQAYPYGGYGGGYRGGWGGWGGCRGGWGGYGGWYGTGIPNGLGWTMFGLGTAATAAAIAAPVYASYAPVYAAPVYGTPYGASYAAPYYPPPPPQSVVVEKKVVEENVQAPAPNGTLAKAQEKLAGLGYYHGPVDGNYGPATFQAVQQFQADNSLPVSGRLDLKTLASLGISL